MLGGITLEGHLVPKPNTRDKIIEAADLLFYQRGFEHTSFADVAGSVGISRGNFYHHFKTKDEILSSVIDLRLARTRAMLRDWQAEGRGPAERIGCFIQILIANQAKILLYGCPVGTLVAELAKLDHASQDHANAVFTLFRDWLRAQFEELGQGAEADALAMQLLARSQGVATMATAFRDVEFIEAEVSQMRGWVQALAAA